MRARALRAQETVEESEARVNRRRERYRGCKRAGNTLMAWLACALDNIYLAHARPKHVVYATSRILCLRKLLAHRPFCLSLQPFTVRKIGDFPYFLSALPSNNQLIIKLIKMLPGGAPHVVVGTLKVSLDRL